jgi:hypothetical protein
VAIWEAATGRLEYVFDVPQGIFADNASFALSPDGKHFAFATNRQAKLWNLVTGKDEQNWPLPPGLGEYIGYLGDKLLLTRIESTAAHPRLVRIRRLEGPEPAVIKEITDFNGGIAQTGCSPDGRYYIARGLCGPNKRWWVKAFDALSDKELWSEQVSSALQHEMHSFRFDPAGKLTTYVSERSGDGVMLLEMPSGKELPGPLHGRPACLSPSAAYWVTVSETGGFRLFRREDKTPIVILGLDTPTHQVHCEFNPAGTHVAWGNDDASVILCDIEKVRRRLGELRFGW